MPKKTEGTVRINLKKQRAVPVNVELSCFVVKGFCSYTGRVSRVSGQRFVPLGVSVGKTSPLEDQAFQLATDW